MPPLSFLIKPVSGDCNMRCQYCFYTDEMKNRKVYSYGCMSKKTLETLVEKGLQFADRSCTFAFQGGEPTLIGLPFYKSLLIQVKKKNMRRIKVNYAIQTNGLYLNDEWAAFFAENNFLVGISLDGIKSIHDENRIDSKGIGSFERVMRNIHLLEKYNVKLNILTVVTAKTVCHTEKIYHFFRKNNLLYQQYIPCIDPIREQRGMQPYSLTPKMYADFLKRLFNLWYYDIKTGKQINIRYFNNLVGMLTGIPPENCGMSGQCTNQYVIEADGSVYPCDFYVLDAYRVGNILNDSIADINSNPVTLNFIEQSKMLDMSCINCRWIYLCHGGCRRDRDFTGKDQLDRNYYCTAYKEFFCSLYERIYNLACSISETNSFVK